jgi:hypothetical protein
MSNAAIDRHRLFMLSLSGLNAFGKKGYILQCPNLNQGLTLIGRATRLLACGLYSRSEGIIGPTLLHESEITIGAILISKPGPCVYMEIPFYTRV